MTAQSHPQRWQEITSIWRDNRWLYLLAGLLVGVLATPAIEQIIGNLNNLIGNLVPEAVGIIFTVLIIDRLAENRGREQYRQSLIRQAGSVANDLAVDAIEQLRKADAITGNKSVLQGQNLRSANLQHARLQGANLQGANLHFANCQQADMWQANLTNATLSYVNFAGAYLRDANLQSTDVQYANFKGTKLRDANLRGVQHINDALFDEQTVLPDAGFLGIDDAGKEIFDKYWTLDTDMTRYTDPNHPDFWQPNWVRD